MHTRVVLFFLLALTVSGIVLAAGEPPADTPVFPPSLESYGDKDMGSIIDILSNRIRQEPFNLVASLIFLLASSQKIDKAGFFYIQLRHSQIDLR